MFGSPPVILVPCRARCQWSIPVRFTESPSVDILLGQEDFFECFRIKFEKDHDIFELSPVPKKK